MLGTELFPNSTNRNARVYAEIYGCSASSADGEIALGLLKRDGFEIVDDVEKADLNLIVTCAVKKPTSDRMLHRIKYLSKKGRGLIVAGCMVTSERARVERVAPKAALIGPREVTKVSELATGIIALGGPAPLSESAAKLGLPRLRRNAVIGIIPVSEGCRWARCAFCIVPIARGPFQSFGIDEIVEEARTSLSEGCKELWITSQDMGSYGLESGRHLLPEIIGSIASLPGEFFLRVGMMNPIYLRPMLPSLIERFRSDKVFRFLHLPVQAGSDEVLRRMKRGHDSSLFLKFVENFRNAIPEMTLSTDVIVGYPEETEEDFKKTIEILEKARPDVVNISRFFARPGTEAEKLSPLPPDILAERSARVRALHRRMALEQNSRWLGWVGRALVDERGKNGTWVCRNQSYKPIVLDTPKELLGQFVNVEVYDAEPTYLHGRILENN